MKNRNLLLTALFIVSCFACNNLPKDNSGNVSVSNDADLVAYGQSVYEKHCQSCHGDVGKPMMATVADLTQTKLDEDAIGDIIFHGKGIMPAFSEQIGEPEIRAVSKFVLTLKK